MKKTMKLQVFAVLALLVLGACNTSQDVASGGFITKRKYNKGFHINLNKKYKSTKEAEFTKVDEELAISNEIEINESPNVLTSNNPSLVENSVNQDVVLDEQVVSSTENNTKAINKIEKREIFQGYSSLSKEDKQVFKAAKHQFKAKKEFSKNKADNDLLISLLFIIFGLSFLGVWWHEGKTWTKRCTVNLILWLLCGLPGFIHGLIVVLGDR